MASGLSLQQKQFQSLVMTPKLAQSIKLLQMNHIDLAEFVKEEIEKNPLLELNPDAADGKPERRGKADTMDAQAAQPHERKIADQVESCEIDATDKSGDIDTNFDNVYDSGTAGAEKQSDLLLGTGVQSPGSSRNHQAYDENFDALSLIDKTQSLAQHLEFQISISFKSERDRQIASYIAHALDDDGYFRDEIPDLARHLNCGTGTVEAVLKRFQAFEPVGIGARNLAECLTIQLSDRGRLTEPMAVFVSNLDLLAKRELETLRRLCAVSTETFNAMIREIKTLDPRPAMQHQAILAETVIADVIVTRRNDGSWSIELNPETLPQVLVNREYHAQISAVVDSDEGKTFINDCMGNANWLAKSLDQRAQTILKTATEIVRQQDMFFVAGVEQLKPMTLKTVAEAIGMHESTVSRVTSNKYLMCSQGIFELKYFFTTAITGKKGENAHSAETVKHRIKQLIDAEHPKSIFSDDKIVALLQDTGIEIARRTVAKYREALRIPSSVQRRREKAVRAGKTA